MAANQIKLVPDSCSINAYERRHTQHVTVDGIIVMSFKPNTYSNDYLALDIEGRFIEDSSKEGGTEFYRAYRVTHKAKMIGCFEMIQSKGDLPNAEMLAKRHAEETKAEQERYDQKLEATRLWRIGQHSSELFSILNDITNDSDIAMDEALELRNEIQANIDTSLRSVSETFDYRKGFTYHLFDGSQKQA